MHVLVIIILACLTLLSVSLQRTYSAVPLKELKRRARKGNELAAALVRVVGYGYSLRAVLWVFIVLSSAGFFVSVSKGSSTFVAVIVSAFLIWFGFLWLPAAEATALGERFAGWVAPGLSRVIGWMHPVISHITVFVHKHRPVKVHTGLYERQDFIDLIDQQNVQADSRIEKSELDVAKHALTYGDKTVGNVMTPRRVVDMVAADESTGPVLMDELHKTGHSRFPVYDGKPDSIVGTLYLRDLLGKETSTAKDRMQKIAYYVHEDQSIHDAFQAILKTHHQLFIVVNSFEEYVGIITMEDVLETMIGKLIVDEFDQYDDLRAVAARAAKNDHKANKEPVSPEKRAATEEESIAENE